MPMRPWLLLVLSLSMPLFACAAAPNLLFAREDGGVYPLAAVQKGRIVPLVLEAEPFSASYRFPGMRSARCIALGGMRVSGHGAIEPGTTWELQPPPASSEDVINYVDTPSIVLAPALEVGDPFLFSTRALRATDGAGEPSAAEMRAARRLAGKLLARQALPRETLHSLRKAMVVQRLRIRRRGVPLLVVEATASTLFHPDEPESGDAVFSYLLVAERVGRRHKIVFLHHYYGSAVSSPTSWTYLDHVDLNGDGIDELLLQPVGWETMHRAEILARRRGKWTVVARRAGADRGC